MAEPVMNYVLIPFKGNINTGDPQGIKLYFQATTQIDKESDKLDISVSNAKDIIDHFISLTKKYGWGSLECMAETGAGANNIFRRVEYILVLDMHHQAHGYFGLLVIGNVGNIVLPNTLVVSAVLNLDKTTQEVQPCYNRVHSDMMYNAMEDSITNKYLKKLRLHQGEYEWACDGCLIRTDGPTMI